MNVLFRLVVAGATLVAALGVAAPASAAVNYDPKTMKGFAGSGDVRKAFGWTDAQLTAKASGLVFNHVFWTDVNYSVTCGKRVLPYTHRQDAGYLELRKAAVTDNQRGAATGYARKLTGFWITGPSAGVSGTSVGPTVGQPCIEGKGKITKVRKLSTKPGWALTVNSGLEFGRLLAG